MAKNPRSSDSAGGLKKRKGGRPSRDQLKSKTETETETETETPNSESQLSLSKRPKRSAACSNFKEKLPLIEEENSEDLLINPKSQTIISDSEAQAIVLTRLSESEAFPPCRKLLEFSFHDSEGAPQLFEMSEMSDIFITSLILPLDDNLEKSKGVKCISFGRVESWSISGYEEGFPIIWISTEIADYECVKPSISYKPYYNSFYSKAWICVEIYKKLAKSAGGNPELGFDELLAGVIRSLNNSSAFPNGNVTKELIISHGEFIYKQLVGLEEEFPFELMQSIISLREECLTNRSDSQIIPISPSTGIKIHESSSNPNSNPNPKNPTEIDDEKLARLLHEKEIYEQMYREVRGRKNRSNNNNNNSNKKNNLYIKINEAEIASDYPLPSYYKPRVQEMDEYIFDYENSISYMDLPRRILTNWCLYNNDSRLISLELIPMKPCAENDATVFGSGWMREDDGSGFDLGLNGSGLGGGSGGSGKEDEEGIAVYLSAVKEWMVEFGSEMVFISVRTDVAWYRLEKPTDQYKPWYEAVLKIARLAIGIITLLKEQTRASKLSFSDVVKKVSEFPKNNPAFISSNLSQVERYIVVHGQIILQQFAEYPDNNIRKCAFVSGLMEKMQERQHTKLVVKKKGLMQKGVNQNPNASAGPAIRRKIMRATTTKLINRIWGDYYKRNFPDDEIKEGEKDEIENKEIIEEENEENEENEEELETELLLNLENENLKIKLTPTKNKSNKSTGELITWEGNPIGKTDSGENLYEKVNLRDFVISLGSVVNLESDESEPSILYFVEYFFENKKGTKMAHGKLVLKGCDTILGNAANEREVFLTNECSDFEINEVRETVKFNIRSIKWGFEFRKDNFELYKSDELRAEERKKRGLSVEYYCKSLYLPQKGGFFSLPSEKLGLGTGFCSSCKERESETSQFEIIRSNTGFIYNKTEYKIHDFLYVRPQFFTEEEERERGTLFKGGRNVGLKPYVVCHLLGLETPNGSNGSKNPKPSSTKIKVRRFYRPDDISVSKAYSSDIREVYYSEDIVTVPVEMIEGKCEILKRSDLPNSDLPVVTDHVFFCEYSYDPSNGSLKQLPASVRLNALPQRASNCVSRKNKGKQVVEEDQSEPAKSAKWKDVPKENRLSTLDIFAGCGGLSEGLQQSGVSYTKWAIEYEEPAGEAFKQNHPEAVVFIDNCNVILKAIMEKSGDNDECVSTNEAAELAAKLGQDTISNLPTPGEVDFINGGPPCQGFSGMNRFNQGTWSKVQCEMILAFLSFADYFRPKYFLLENVRNFVSFNKGQTFRLTLASLLEMDYQVRFGILEAGAFGVSQSRKRAFIWAAGPDETLPDWPEPMHVFSAPQLKVQMPGGGCYAAVRSTADGAPFRSITVRDTIGELPVVSNGASKLTIDYGCDPVSWFQKQIRGNMIALNDHISKEMNELNLIRCQHIPKRPGCDWRDLPDEKVKLSTGQTADLIPWCLPNTARRHNQWKGLFGRLDWDGNFPTSVTDPQPMGKVGMCFHPDQDRIITVRECARSQGFMDSYTFAGNIQNKHRQIGNAVPPPLAYALGRKLKEAIDSKPICLS
ncbi:hypothetical protein LUZ60_005332 [Juncus effusus]|nr:hypothetical protein LUZ60_005332 [Juncus effusus]